MAGRTFVIAQSLRVEHWANGMNVNVWDVNEHVQTLIRSRAAIDTAVLTDLDTPLEEIAAEAREAE
jgi:3-phenylpropionate/trans-cinnamate dioxygenase ferredoxin reductase subunit